MATIPIRIQVLGTREAKRMMRRFSAQMPKLLAGAMYRRGEEIMTEAKRIVPHKTGVLQDSGHVVPPDLSKRRPVVVLGFGGPAIPYAEVQHETLEFSHRPGRQAKYLIVPALRAVPTMGRKIGAEIFLGLKALSVGKAV